MKVRELISILSELDPELVVVKQKDDEGNGFSEVWACDDNAYTTDTEERDIEIYALEDIREDEDLYIADFQKVCVIV